MDSHADEDPEDDERRGTGTILGNGPRAQRRSSLGLEQRDQREQRQEGIPATTSCWRLRERSKSLEGATP